VSGPLDIEDVKRLNVAPGDVLLVTIPPGRTERDVDHIKNVFETVLPVRVIVRTADIGVEVAGPERVAE
jgi:hypothetical protein